MGAQGHTPGPWFAIWNGHFWDINVGNYLHAQSVASNHANAALKMSAEEAEANARLIAAAPALLEACRQAERQFADLAAITVNGQHDANDIAAIEALRAAIQSATGERA